MRALQTSIPWVAIVLRGDDFLYHGVDWTLQDGRSKTPRSPLQPEMRCAHSVGAISSDPATVGTHKGGRMDPKHSLFFDERLMTSCVYCGGPPETDDHVPSKILLDEPFPEGLAVVLSCWACNNGLSRDEDYVVCFIDCVLAGSTDPNDVGREKIRRALRHSPALAARIEAARTAGNDGQIFWQPEQDRVRRVVMKLARGHVAYWLSTPRYDEPEHVALMPIDQLTEQKRGQFEAAPQEAIWPEIGSRAFVDAAITWTRSLEQAVQLPNAWQQFQPGRYRFLVSYSDRIKVRMLLSEYLACEVMW